MDSMIIDLGAIAGESAVTGYTGKVEVLSFSHGVSQQITGDPSNTKRTSGKPNHQDFTFSKYMDLASASIIDYCDQAKPLATVTFYLLQIESGTHNIVWKVTMTDVLFSSYSVGGGGGGKPVETVTLNYAKIAWDYKAQNTSVGDAGTAAAKWSLVSNKAE